MKKIIFFLFLSFLFLINIEASSKFYIGERVPDMHVESIKGDQIHNGVPFVLRREDSEFVYCINPFERINTNDYYDEYKSVRNLSKEQLNKLNLIAYYGYGYNDHTDLKWYGVTQMLIWKSLDLDDVYFTETSEGGRISAYENEIYEIENLVNNYYILPSFSNDNFNYTINTDYQIKDINKVLNNYQIVESNIDSKIENNTLYISTSNIGNYEITFRRSSPIIRNYLLYINPGSQSLLYPGSIDDIEFKISVKVLDGKIIINKKDSEEKNREFASLDGAIYGIYKDDSLISEIETDEYGVAHIENLPLGKYIVKELKPSLGYELDSNIYEIELTYENNETTIESLENIIKGDISINKYYGTLDNYKKEDDAIFEIYNIDDKLVGTYETINGKIEEKLEYGDYYLIQTKGMEGYNYIDKFNVSIKENKEYHFDLYDTPLIVNVPNTHKNDYHRLIPIFLIVFGISLIIKSTKNTTQIE